MCLMYFQRFMGLSLPCQQCKLGVILLQLCYSEIILNEERLYALSV